MIRVEAASVVVRDGSRFLLVERGRGAARGQWAFPGGRVEPGESAPEAARRELREETGLEAGRLALLRRIELVAGDTVYDLDVFVAAGFSGVPCAGDDAARLGWFAVSDMDALDVTASTRAICVELSEAAS